MKVHFFSFLSGCILFGQFLFLQATAYASDFSSYTTSASNNDYHWSQGVYFSSLEKREQHRLLTMSAVAKIHEEKPDLSTNELLTFANFADQSFRRILDASQGQMAPSVERQVFEFVMEATAAEASGLLPMGGGVVATALNKFSQEMSHLWGQMEIPLRQVEFQRQVASDLSTEGLLGAMSMVANAKMQSHNSPELREFLDIYSRNNFQFGVDVTDEYLRQFSALYGQNHLGEQVSLLLQLQQEGATAEDLRLLSEDVAQNFYQELRAQSQQQVLEFTQIIRGEREQRERDQREAMRAQVYEEAQYASVHLASFFVGRIDPKAGQTVQVIGQAYQGLNKALSNFQKNQELGVGELTSTLLLSSNLLTLGLGLASMMSSGPSADQMILEALAQLSEQIEGLRQEMHERFDQVDAKLNLLLLEARSFHQRAMDLARSNQAQLRRDLERLKNQVIEVQRALTPIEDRLKSLSHLIVESHNRQLKVNYDRVLAKCKYELYLMPRDYNFSSYETCLQNLSIEAELWASQSFSDWSEQDDRNFYALNDANWLYAVRKIFREQGRAGQLNLDKIPSPLIWMSASRDFMNLSLAGADFWKFSGRNYNLTYSTTHLLQSGYQIKDISNHLLSSDSRGHLERPPVPNILFALKHEYEMALADIARLVRQEIEHTKSFVPGLEANIFANTLTGDLWSALPYTLPSQIALCEGGDTWDRPQGLELLITEAMQEHLHLAQAQEENTQQILNFCWRVRFGPVTPYQGSNNRNYTINTDVGAVHANWLGGEVYRQHILQPLIDRRRGTSSGPYRVIPESLIEGPGAEQLSQDSSSIYAQKRQDLGEALSERFISGELSPEIDRFNRIVHLLRIYTELALPVSYKYSGELRAYFYSSQNRLVDAELLEQLLKDVITEEESSDVEKIWDLSMQRMSDFMDVFRKEAESGPQIEIDVQEQLDQLVNLKQSVEQIQFGDLSIDSIVNELRQFTVQ